jgi:hypothetical protein
MKTTTFTIAIMCGLVLLAVAALIPAPGPGSASMPAAVSRAVLAAEVGFSVLPDGRGDTNVESVVYPEAMGFDKKRSLEAGAASSSRLLRALQHEWESFSTLQEELKRLGPTK